MAAINAANEGHALAYGEDVHTKACEQAFNELFDAEVITRLMFNGTGANVAALGTLMASIPGPNHAIVCTDWSHINTDETAAPERVLSTKLMDVPTTDGKLTPDQIKEVADWRGQVHHPQPALVSITQPTELGTLYSIDQVLAICHTAHELDMLVHMDGARIGNATASLGGSRETLRAFTIDAGLDAISFGGTKNGCIGAEAVVFLNPEAAVGSQFVQKQVTQLPSKQRYIAAQLNALLADDLWIALGQQSNAMAQQLHIAVKDLPGIEAGQPPAVNSIYPMLPPEVIVPLQEWSFFWDWDPSKHQVRWMSAWDTSDGDVEAFVAGLRSLL